ncbi:DUF3224 domain-containing protein [Psychrosphaera sp. B3R10]|uniref:DUF3224 domain-containing protein n=1 Tax=unclassified Psychrosphaera TaxID=2641570 RepID=UPI001C084B14|nr:MULTISPECIES: DUF3224 domain-containing protein [unclassified Psychrosphaera]MBU2883283.1 DUF3224 domain-containing protein [Psychrosphaera sp. I2R16]MBU2990623.1 DUF3224 domain-containing protein [Psychrosphaera sp. B3R10]MDO6718903.1 DUF3224 domain-containing protein [Psychrosphaera sp. 1_MG-2023]
MTANLTGQFTIAGWQEEPKFQNDAGHKVSYADIKQTYTGDIEGSSVVQYLLCYTSATHALFTGFEVITTIVDNVESTLTISHTGEFSAGVASSTFIVVENTGTGAFANATGQGSFGAGEAGSAKFEIELN